MGINRLRSYFGIFLITSLLATGCIKNGPAAKQDGYFVRNVIDGDTIKLADGRSVRYIGIDTPEAMKRRGKNWEFDPEPYAVAAKEYNRELVSGKRVRLEYDVEKQDKYGRWLAYVHVDDNVMINSELLRQGLAVLYTFPPNVKYMDLLLEAQNEARRNKRGLWGSLKGIAAEKAYENTGKGFCAVRGAVTDIYVAADRVFLNFGQDRKKGLTAVIYSRNIAFFRAQGIDPAIYYKGRNVEVVGKIEYKRGPRMVIDNPSQITVINAK